MSSNFAVDSLDMLIRASVLDSDIQVIEHKEQEFESCNNTEAKQQSHCSTQHTETFVPRYCFLIRPNLSLKGFEAHPETYDVVVVVLPDL